MLDRIRTLLRINLVELLSEAEDPADAVAGFLADAERGLALAKDAVAAAMVQERQLAQQLATASAEVVQWDARTDEALHAGDEQGARAALERKLRADRAVGELEAEVERQRRTLADMRTAVRALESKTHDVRRRSTVAAARQARLVVEEEVQRARTRQESAQQVEQSLQQAAEATAVREDLLAAAREVEQTSLEARLAYAREELDATREEG